jgi:hypothetical protein
MSALTLHQDVGVPSTDIGLDVREGTALMRRRCLFRSHKASLAWRQEESRKENCSIKAKVLVSAWSACKTNKMEYEESREYAPEEISRVLIEGLLALPPEVVKGIYVFGSHAFGTATPQSGTPPPHISTNLLSPLQPCHPVGAAS